VRRPVGPQSACALGTPLALAPVARRQLLWALPATWTGATGLALPPGPVALPPETAEERRVGEGWATGVTLGDHPVVAHRATLMARGVLTLAALADAPTGATVTVAGRLVILQRPPTAKGVAFVPLEDESGLGNLVLSPEVDRRDRAALHAGPLVVATGRVQRRAGVVNVQAATIEAWAMARGDEAVYWPHDDDTKEA